MVKTGASVNALNKEGQTALHKVALFDFQVNICEFLIKCDVQLDLKDIHGKAPIHHCAERNRVEMSKLLLENGASVNITDGNLKTPLHLAINEPYMVVMCEILLDFNASRTLKDDMVKTPIDIAKDKEHSEILELLEY